MDANLDTLARELTALTERFADLGARLAEAAKALEEAGAPPADGLVDDLADARRNFMELRTGVLGAAQEASVTRLDEPESLTDLEPLLGAIDEALRIQARVADINQARQRLVDTLDRVLAISHRDDPGFGPLADCQDKARQLRDSALALIDSDAPGEAERLAAGTKAFADLLTMLDSRDELDDERYAELEESVSRSFGRALSVAVARGRLGFAGEIVEAPARPAPVLVDDPPSPGTELAPVASVETLEIREPLVDEPALELAIDSLPPAPGPSPLVLDTTPRIPAVELPIDGAVSIETSAASIETTTVAVELPIETPGSIAAPTLMLDVSEPVAPLAVTSSAAFQAVAQPPEPVAIAATPAPESVAAPAEPRTAAMPAPVSPVHEPLPPDETAQWWLAAWARWSGWKSTHDFAAIVKEELGKYPYLLSVPIQKSPEYEDGMLAYGYSVLLDHIEKQNPGCVGHALNSLRSSVAKPVGDQLYDYAVAQGRLAETYADFVKSALLAALPEPGLWFQFRVLESKDDTRIFQRPSARLGETELTGQRLSSDNQRYAEHKFKMTLPPLTVRCVQVSVDSPRETRGASVRVSGDGAPCDSGWMIFVPASPRGRVEARRVAREGSQVAGLGKDVAALWLAVFNPDPVADRRYELGVLLRKDTRSPFRNRG